MRHITERVNAVITLQHHMCIADLHGIRRLGLLYLSQPIPRAVLLGSANHSRRKGASRHTSIEWANQQACRFVPRNAHDRSESSVPKYGKEIPRS
ncbi:hypothetical protein E2C01_081150 [Portunus trituberculatus]|uniref:Uncharacterized protein n=1 Tax=Portunus trituberculatus TaxID=210409 RepID=A0A5B7IXX7_PORTR|nr:hypothetical protein [Portunus trituberculatus]